MPPAFIPGLELSERFYREAVRPLLSGLEHTAALLGPGSEVLGFDTARSTDHDWGPRLQLFLRPEDLAAAYRGLSELPAGFLGYATRREWVVVAEPGAWFTGYLGFDPRREITTLDWLATPTQTLAEITSGALFHDDLQLAPLRDKLAWYPDDVWRYVLACQWQRVSEEEPFVGRCREVGDTLGAAVVAARLVRDLMRLCLLMNRVYPPYSKWLGSAFVRLDCATRLGPLFAAALREPDHLASASEAVAVLHNELGLTPPVDPRTRPFFDRPFPVLRAGRFASELTATITDPVLRSRPLVGAIDQYVDSTHALGHHARTIAGAIW